MPWTDITLRLCAAAVIGIALGLNRYLHHKSIGVRTLGLVSVTSAALVCASVDMASPDAATRVIQGLVTGIGFIGAGLIMHQPGQMAVHGLTTATTVWVAAAVGILCGLGAWIVAVPATVIMLALLTFGGRFEKAVAKRFRPPDSPPHCDE